MLERHKKLSDIYDLLQTCQTTVKNMMKEKTSSEIESNIGKTIIKDLTIIIDELRSLHN